MWSDLFSALTFSRVSGPDYLQWFVMAFAACLLSSALIRYWLDSEVKLQRLSPYEAAYLNGKETLLAAVVVSELLSKGKVQLNAQGSLDANTLVLDKGAPPFVHDIVTSFPIASDGWSKTLSTKPSIKALHDKLIKQGLLRTHASQSLDRLIATFPLTILALLGTLRLIHGVANDKPVLLLVLCLGAVVLTESALSKRSRTLLTRSGKANLKEMENANAHLLVTSKEQLSLLTSDQLTLGLSLRLIAFKHLESRLLPVDLALALENLVFYAPLMSSQTTSSCSSFNHSDCSSTSSCASDSGSGCGGCSSDD